jgi:exonuclease III
MSLTIFNQHEINLIRTGKINGIISYIKKAKFDIVRVQETHLNSDLEVNNVFKDLNGNIYFSKNTNSRSCGVAIWVSNPD